jgi:hypothetical protein
MPRLFVLFYLGTVLTDPDRKGKRIGVKPSVNAVGEMTKRKLAAVAITAQTPLVYLQGRHVGMKLDCLRPTTPRTSERRAPTSDIRIAC